MGIELAIAARYLRARNSRFVSILTVISVAGVALGVLTLIVVLAVMNGFQEEVRSRIVGTNAHLMMMRLDQAPMIDYPEVMAKALGDPDVVGVSPYIYGKGLVSAGGEAEGAVIRGLDPAAERSVTRILEYIRPSGARLDMPADAAALAPAFVGRELAVQLRAIPGDTVLITTVLQVTPSIMSSPLRSRAFRVAGIFDSGMYDFDSSLLIVPLQAAQELLGLGAGVSGIAVRTRDLFEARQVGDRLVPVIGPGTITSVDWMELNPNLFSWMKLEKVVMFLLLIMIVLVAAFNIAATLIMLVLEKTRDIGVLQAMGATRGSIRRIFVWEGFLIGASGTLLGLAGGVGLGMLLSRYRIIRLPADVYFIDRLPVRMEAGDIAVTAVVALGISLLVTIYPSRKAASMSPVEAIRHE